MTPEQLDDIKRKATRISVNTGKRSEECLVLATLEYVWDEYCRLCEESTTASAGFYELGEWLQNQRKESRW